MPQDGTDTDNEPNLEREVREKGWDTDDLMEHAFVGPEDDGTTEVVLHEHLAEQGGELVERDGTKHLLWQRRDAGIDLTNEGFGVWRAEITVPESVTNWLTGPGDIDHTVRASFTVGLSDHTEGYIDSAERTDTGARLVVYTATNHQPTVQLESLVDDLYEYAENAERGAEQAERAFQAAAENADGE